VSFDTPQENRAFAEKFGFDFPLLCDVDRKMGVAYGAADSPQSSNAQRIGVIVGPDGRIAEWLPKVDPSTYPRDALKRI